MKFKEFLEVLEESGLEVESIISPRNSAWTHDMYDIHVNFLQNSIFLKVSFNSDSDSELDVSVSSFQVYDRKATMVINNLNWPVIFTEDPSCQIKAVTHLDGVQSFRAVNDNIMHIFKYDRLKEMIKCFKRLMT